MEPDCLLLDRRAEGVASITLNRPAVRNALSLAMQERLHALLQELAEDDAVRAVVIAAAGEKAFCAGYDLHEMRAFDPAQMQQAQQRREAWIWYAANYPKPLIGAINGAAHGAGAIYATAFDIRVGCSRSEFRYTAAAYGGANNTWQLWPIVGLARAKEFVMTARRVEAPEALACGLLNHVVDGPALLDKTMELAAQIAAHPPEGPQCSKALIHAALGRSYDEAYRAENELMTQKLSFDRPDRIFSAFLARHPGR